MKTSTDLFFCAYVQLQGVAMTAYEVLDRGRIRCSFKLSDEEWKALKIAFNNSEHAKLKQNIEQIKDLLY